MPPIDHRQINEGTAAVATAVAPPGDRAADGAHRRARSVRGLTPHGPMTTNDESRLSLPGDELLATTDVVATSAADGGGPMTRRTMLHKVGVGAATVVVAGVGVGSYRVFDNGVLDAGHGTAYDAWTNWRDDPTSLGTVAAAILAANPHNTQPWIFHVDADSVEMFTDPARRTGVLDALDREHHVGLGCALENLVLAASARGLQSTVALLPEASDPTHVATISFTDAPRIASNLHDAIDHRRSNRGPYTDEAVADDVLRTLASLTSGLDGVDVQWFTTPQQRTTLGAVIIDATEAIVNDDEQSTASFAWFRNNRDDIDTHMDGLTLDAQGLSPLVVAVAKILPATSRAAGDRFWLDQTRTVHTATAAAYGVITVADPDDRTAQLNAGRLLQRVHLAATVAGLGLQHMNQVTERIDRDAQLGTPSPFAARMDALLDRPGRHAMSTFRLGHPSRSGRASPRRPVSAVTR
jgi:hypothetical protein